MVDTIIDFGRFGVTELGSEKVKEPFIMNCHQRVLSVGLRQVW